MMKKFICISLVCVFALLFSAAYASADDNYNLNDLKHCRTVYSYSGKSSAYFYGFNEKTLYSSRVIPDCVTRYIAVSGSIRAVCHDENNSYALYSLSSKSYGVVRMNMNTGNCTYCTINPSGNTVNSSFAVCENEIFIIHNSQNYPFVKSYNFNGSELHTYSFAQGVERLFCSGGCAYAKAFSGEILRLSGGSKTKCASLDNYTEFIDAGAGYILTSDKRLISLSNGSSESLRCDLAARTEKYTFTVSGDTLSFSGGETEITNAVLLCAAGSKAAVLNSTYGCAVISSTEHANNSNKSENTGGSAMRISDNYIIGIEPEITVTQAKSRYPQIKIILDDNQNEVTSGKLKTGYRTVLENGEYELALRGDVNSSGTLNSADTNELMKTLSGETALSPACQKAADYNFDNKINTKDLVLIAKTINNY